MQNSSDSGASLPVPPVRQQALPVEMAYFFILQIVHQHSLYFLNSADKFRNLKIKLPLVTE